MLRRGCSRPRWPGLPANEQESLQGAVLHALDPPLERVRDQEHREERERGQQHRQQLVHPPKPSTHGRRQTMKKPMKPVPPAKRPVPAGGGGPGEEKKQQKKK